MCVHNILGYPKFRVTIAVQITCCRRETPQRTRVGLLEINTSLRGLFRKDAFERLIESTVQYIVSFVSVLQNKNALQK